MCETTEFVFFFFLTALRHLIGKLMNTRQGKDSLTKQPERRKLSLKGIAITVKADFSIAIMEVRSQEYILLIDCKTTVV